jgi:hypothetical protein
MKRFIVVFIYISKFIPRYSETMKILFGTLCRTHTKKGTSCVYSKINVKWTGKRQGELYETRAENANKEKGVLRL